MGFFENMGKKLTGRDPKQIFTREAEEALNDPSSSYADINDAKGDLLRLRADEVESTLSSTKGYEGIIDAGYDEAYQIFEAGLRDIFTPEEITKFMRDPAIISKFRKLQAREETPSPMDKDAVNKYLKKYFKEIYPQKGDSSTKIKGKEEFIDPIQDDIAVLRKTLQSLLKRISGHLSAQNGATGHIDLAALTASNPEVAADIGMLLKVKKAMDTHFESIKDEIDFTESLENFKKNGVEFMRESAKSIGSWLIACVKGGFRDKPEFGKAIMKTFNVFGTIMSKGTKLLGSTLNLSYASLKKMLRGKRTNPTKP